MSNPCDNGDICNGQTDSETRLLPVGGNGNLILCRECYGVELSFRLNRIMEGVEQDMPTWEGLAVSSVSSAEKARPMTEAADPTEVYRRNNPKQKGK